MPDILFGEWLPDQAPLGNPGCTVAKNVYPSASGYLPVSALTSSTDALDARPQGAIQLTDKDLNVIQFAGDASKLYENESNAWGDKSKVGGYTTGSTERWEFAQWNNKVIATNFSDNPQNRDLGGTTFSDLTTALRARHVAVIRDFVTFANTYDATDGNKPNRIRWSAFGDETDYTVSASTLSDFQDLATGGPVNRIFGGEYGVIFQKENIWRMSFTGAPTVFQFDQTIPGIGLIAAGAAAQDGDTIYFLSDRGFFSVTNGSQVTPIGAEKIDRTVLSELDSNNLHRISCAIDPTTNRVFWAYPGAGSNGRPNKIVVYDRAINRWSQIEQDVELLWSAGGIGFTLESLSTANPDLDAMTVSLDSNRWKGGAAILGAFDSDYKSGSFDGSPMAACLTTKEVEISSGARTPINSFSPIVDGGTVTGKVITRNSQADAVTEGLALTLRPSGRFTTRANARYHRFELSISGVWDHALGVNIDKKTPRATRYGR